MRKKLFSGHILRRIRERHGMTLSRCASELGISAAYLSQIETNQRPLTAAVLLTLREKFGVDVGVFTAEAPDLLTGALKEALVDPIVGKLDVSAGEVQQAATASPWLARAFLDLHGSYQRLRDRLHVIDETLGLGGDNEVEIRPTPFEEVRDYFHFIDNYVDILDQSGEALAEKLGLPALDQASILIDYLRQQHGVRLAFSNELIPARTFDRGTRVLTLGSHLSPASQAFQLSYQIGVLEQQDVVNDIIVSSRLSSDAARSICRLALLNYHAAATIIPYRRFLNAAREHLHDIERLASRFGASLEQVAHRLSTLQRPEEKGVPLYFLKVDAAGNVVKRHSATRFQFARFGGACPLWNVHEAFESPERILTQIAEMPDGSQYLCIAKCITKQRPYHNAAVTRFAIGLGCELRHAHEFVYGRGIDFRSAQAIKIGISCRICERRDCHQRAVPAIDWAVELDGGSRSTAGVSF
jgi:predicted transcriptional regulator/transcriptional regulator with XRE-family HTH domain